MHEGFKWMRKMFETKVSGAVGIVFDMGYAICASVLRACPSFMRVPLKILGVEKFLEDKLAAYNEAAEAVSRKEEQRELERNRPAELKKPEVKSAPIELKKKVTVRKVPEISIAKAQAMGKDDDEYSDKGPRVAKKVPSPVKNLTAREKALSTPKK